MEQREPERVLIAPDRTTRYLASAVVGAAGCRPNASPLAGQLLHFGFAQPSQTREQLLKEQCHD